MAAAHNLHNSGHNNGRCCTFKSDHHSGLPQWPQQRPQQWPQSGSGGAARCGRNSRGTPGATTRPRRPSWARAVGGTVVAVDVAAVVAAIVLWPFLVATVVAAVVIAFEGAASAVVVAAVVNVVGSGHNSNQNSSKGQRQQWQQQQQRHWHGQQ